MGKIGFVDTEGNQPPGRHRLPGSATSPPKSPGRYSSRLKGDHRRRRPIFPGTYHGKHRPGAQAQIPTATTPHGLSYGTQLGTLSRAVPRTADSVRAVGLALGLLAATWFTQRPLAQWTSNNPDLNVYLIQPVIWTSLAVVAWRLYHQLDSAPPFSGVLTRIAFLAGIFHLSLLLLSGLWFGFGDNASTGVLANYPKNALYFTSLLLGVELTRAYVFHAWRKINENTAFLVTVVLFAAIATPIGQWEGFSDVDSMFRIGIGRYLPAVVLSAVATSFVAGGGILVSAAYLWPILALQWLVPILPAHDWPIRALFGAALPLAALVIARTLYEGTAEFVERYPEEPEIDPIPEQTRSWVGWSGTAIAAAVIVLFVNGTFGVRPFLLTGTSMEPAFQRGDVVLIREVPLESLEVNDIVRYEQSEFDFVHRIVEILEDDEGLVFITQGDNVDRADPPVSSERVTGKVVFALPKIGWPSLWLSGLLNRP